MPSIDNLLGSYRAARSAYEKTSGLLENAENEARDFYESCGAHPHLHDREDLLREFPVLIRMLRGESRENAQAQWDGIRNLMTELQALSRELADAKQALEISAQRTQNEHRQRRSAELQATRKQIRELLLPYCNNNEQKAGELAEMCDTIIGLVFEMKESPIRDVESFGERARLIESQAAETAK